MGEIAAENYDPEPVHPDDHAIVISVSHYPELRVVEDIERAANDGRAFLKWAIDPLGGGLSLDQVSYLTFHPGVAINKSNSRDIRSMFEPFIRDALASKMHGGRLTVYVSGLVLQDMRSSRNWALVLPEASALYAESISVLEYVDFLEESGVFDEVLFFADCLVSRNSDIEIASAGLPLHRNTSVVLPRSGRGWSLVTDPNDLGWFTQALLEGLKGGAANTDGRVTFGGLSRFINNKGIELGVRSLPTFRYDPSRDLEIAKGTSRFTQTGGPLDPAPPPSSKPSPTAPIEQVRTLHDSPAKKDALGRKAFAEVLGKRIQEVYEMRITEETALVGFTRLQDPDPVGAEAFMVHLHGPWGAGKSSVLNLLSTHLQREENGKWLVVKFNAWRHQRMSPPWWSLIRSVYEETVRGMPMLSQFTVRGTWFWWHIKTQIVPLVIALLLIGVAVLLATGVMEFSFGQAVGTHGTAGGAGSSGPGLYETAMKVILSVIAALAGVIGVVRTLVFGSSKAAQTYSELSTDAMRPVMNFFNRLVRSVERPVVIFIDDLDRCDSTYVVELLEGIQTMFRQAPVTYVVAADKKWICTSYQEGYIKFGSTIGGAARPLGYLFLEKIFQVSASIPELSTENMAAYWGQLLGMAELKDATAQEAHMQQQKRAAENEVKNDTTIEQLQAKISEAKQQKDDVKAQALIEAAALRITSPEAQTIMEHRLQRFLPLLERNPRAMKRLLNSYGFLQARLLLEHKDFDADVLARWTILELRWPLLAEALVSCPGLIDDFQNGTWPTDKRFAEWRDLFGSAEVLKVLGLSAASNEPKALDKRAIVEMMGAYDAGI